MENMIFDLKLTFEEIKSFEDEINSLNTKKGKQ